MPRVAAAADPMLPSIEHASGDGGVATPVRESDTLLDESLETDLPWDIIVWDDPVNLMNYVVYVLKKVFGYSEDMASKLMLEVHNTGRSLVASEKRDRAERYVRQLHGHGLHATMERA